MGQLLKSVNQTKGNKKNKQRVDPSTFLINQDMFGFPVQLNFDRQGEFYRTSVGGIFSMLISLFICGLIAQKTLKMFSRDDAYKNFSEEIRELSEGQLWNIKENDFQPYVRVSSTNSFSSVRNFNYTDFKRHIDLSFRIVVNDKITEVLEPVECPSEISGLKPQYQAAALCPPLDKDIFLGKTPGMKKELLVIAKVCDSKINDFCETDVEKIHLYIKKVFFHFITNSLKVDYSKYYQKPVTPYKHYGNGLVQLDPQKYVLKNIRVAVNEVTTQDQFVFAQEIMYPYINIDQIDNSQLDRSYLDRNNIYGRTMAKIYYRLPNNVYVHTRKSYNVLDIMEEIGGLSEVIFLFGAMFVGPLAPFFFTLQAISKFYIVKRKSEPIKIQESEQFETEDKYKTETQTNNHIKREYFKIEFSMIEKLKIAFMNMMPQWGFFKQYQTGELWKIYSRGLSRLEHEFNLIRILKSVRKTKVALKKKFKQPKIAYKIQTNERNCIRLSSSDKDLTSDDSQNSSCLERTTRYNQLKSPTLKHIVDEELSVTKSEYSLEEEKAKEAQDNDGVKKFSTSSNNESIRYNKNPDWRIHKKSPNVQNIPAENLTSKKLQTIDELIGKTGTSFEEALDNIDDYNLRQDKSTDQEFHKSIELTKKKSKSRIKIPKVSEGQILQIVKNYKKNYKK